MMSGQLLQIFPSASRDFWARTAEQEKQVQEIRLRAGKPIFVIKDGQEWFLDRAGELTDKRALAVSISDEELEAILQHICDYSLYAFEDELRQGFLTLSGGHRVGVAGQAVLETDGSLRTIRHVSYMNIRISHEVKGAADKILPLVYEKGSLQNLLLISPPGCGKTTLLRDLIRLVSDGNSYGKGLTVGVVDERSELAGSFLGKPQNDVGIRTDILDACPKALGMRMLLRSMAPQVIAVDELGGEKEAEALSLAASCGCRIMATVHGENLRDVREKPGFQRLFAEGLFSRFLVLGKKEGRCEVKKCYGREEAYAEGAGNGDDSYRQSGNGDMVQTAACT